MNETPFEFQPDKDTDWCSASFISIWGVDRAMLNGGERIVYEGRGILTLYPPISLAMDLQMVDKETSL